MKQEVTKRITLSAEWEEQEMVQLTWPHEKTDWAPMLDEITATYIEMVQAISKYEKLLIVAPDVEKVKRLLAEHLTTQQMSNVVYHQCPTNDTWARDHAFLTLSDGTLLDFCFNGWGEKFEASLDNAINRSLYSSLFTLNSSLYESHLDFVLEGGSIESDGKGTIYTTRCCLLAPHRNQPLTEQQIEQELKRRLRADRIVWLDDEPL
ncbi:MAG: agmatine deiminase family protein, partial [Prevotella sp.]|nr:agmatine deiminase family protein [Prevotella sp.]